MGEVGVVEYIMTELFATEISNVIVEFLSENLSDNHRSANNHKRTAEMDKNSHDEEKPQVHDKLASLNLSAAGSKDENGTQHDVPAVSAKLKNPLYGIPKEDLMRDVEAFAKEKGLEDITDMLKKGALVAQDPKRVNEIEELDENERTWFRLEKTHRWKQPWMMYFMIVLCAGSAIVQGMDQTAVNGAQIFYFDEFGIGEDQVWLRGLLNGAPYLCSALVGCWTTKPLNYYFERRGCI